MLALPGLLIIAFRLATALFRAEWALLGLWVGLTCADHDWHRPTPRSCPRSTPFARRLGLQMRRRKTYIRLRPRFRRNASNSWRSCSLVVLSASARRNLGSCKTCASTKIGIHAQRERQARRLAGIDHRQLAVALIPITAKM